MMMLAKKIGQILTSVFSVGGISLMRILTAFVVVDIIVVWDIDCIKSLHVQDIPPGVVGIFIAAIGGKAWQAFADVKTIQNKREEEKP